MSDLLIRPLASPSTAAVVSAALLFAALAVPAGALASDSAEVERTLAMVEVRNGPDPSSLTADYMREVAAAFSAQNSGDFILIAASQVVGKIAATRDQVPRALTKERREALAEMKKRGVEYLFNADALKAIGTLKAAQAKYRGALAAPGADAEMRKEYLDLLAQLATAYVVAKDIDSAREVFRSVITAFGVKAPITDDNYRPDVVEVFNQVVTEAQTVDKGALSVTSTPAGAKVILGGVERGTTPATVDDLIAGTYTLRLQRGDLSSMQYRVKIAGGRTEKIHVGIDFDTRLVIDDDTIALSYASLDDSSERVPSDGVTLGKQLGVNLVVVLGVLDKTLVAYVVDAGAGSVLRSTTVRVPQVGVSKRAVKRVVATILGTNDAQAAPKPWYTSVPGLATGGAGVIALAVGLGYGASNFSLDEVKVETAEEASSIRRGRLIAGVGLGLAVALGGAATYFFLTHNDQAGADAAAAGVDNGLPPAGFGHGALVFSALPSGR